MYNIHSHYQNIFKMLKGIVTHRRVLYLHPYGASSPENVETIMDLLPAHDIKNLVPGKDGPLFIFYDQEPFYGKFNHQLFDHINKLAGPHILVTTEKDSEPVKEIQKKYGWPVVYYFHHAFAASDWYRGIKYDSSYTMPADRSVKKKFITFNRITSGRRVYRSLFVNELIKRKLVDHGHISYSKNCIDGSDLYSNLLDQSTECNIPNWLIQQTVANVENTTHSFRIDYSDQIPNQSFSLEPIIEAQESFVQVVTETCFWETKKHLTEKIFKPILLRQPFMLLGCAHNLEYLRSYGFKTFGDYWDESYDTIDDPYQRLEAVAGQLELLCQKSNDELTGMLHSMEDILNHNYELFNSPEFLDHCWDELKTNIINCVSPQLHLPNQASPRLLNSI